MSDVSRIPTNVFQLPETSYVGRAGQLFYGIGDGKLRLSDGVTPGGILVYPSGNASGNISGIGNAGFVPVWSSSSILASSHIDDGATTANTITISENAVLTKHSAMGPGTTIDSIPTNVLLNGGINTTAAILVRKEVNTTSEGVASSYKQIDWSPSTNIPASYSALNDVVVLNINLDSQATSDSQFVNKFGIVNLNGSTTPQLVSTGMTLQNNLLGNAPINLLIASNAGVYNGSQTGNIGRGVGYYLTFEQDNAGASTAKYSGIHGQIFLYGGTIGDINFLDMDMSDSDVGTPGWTLANVKGFNFSSPASFGGSVTNQYGVFIGNVVGAANNWAIKTAAGQVEFGDNLTVHGVVKTGVYVTGNIPSAVTAGISARAFVLDATSNVFASAYAGSGGIKVPVYSDGSIWRIG